MGSCSRNGLPTWVATLFAHRQWFSLSTPIRSVRSYSYSLATFGRAEQGQEEEQKDALISADFTRLKERHSRQMWCVRRENGKTVQDVRIRKSVEALQRQGTSKVTSRVHCRARRQQQNIHPSVVETCQCRAQ
ncbi:hypothetical protein BCV70DRAFT_71406 [Testicularia cyperi]|uniref:Uncharacterized protein n=1 Tax=Testicularia cyperi TaxID=1882483 RepID=A0A317XSF7_9BASI|nr:hypothetical protein BCV70DRAFT_71406 [Testicularia cyperi]